MSLSLNKLQKATLFAGLITLVTSLLSLSTDNVILDIVRVVAGLFFVMTMGIPYARLFIGRNKNFTGLDCIFTIGVSLLLTYPSGVINIMIEGKENIYTPHLTGFIAVALVVFLLGLVINKILKFGNAAINLSKGDIVGMTGILVLGLLLRLINLGEANINGDEINLAAQSYDLVDGMVAGRNAYFISETGHSPLGFFISHAVLNIFEPRSFYEMSLWMIRIPQVIMGMLVIWGSFVLGKDFVKKGNKLLPFIPPFIVAIDSYSNFGSRLAIFQDMSTYTFFMIIFVLMLVAFLKNKTWRTAIMVGVSLGTILLVKLSGILLIPIIIGCAVVYREEWKKMLVSLAVALFIFAPVFVYNIAAYATTGYMDVPMSKLANLIGIPAKSIMTTGTDPSMYEGFRNPLLTLAEMPFMLLDQWGIAMSILFLIVLVGGLFSVAKKQKGLILYSVVAMSIIFFSVNGFRTYYLPYLTVLAAGITAMSFANMKKPKTMMIVAAIFVVPFTLIYNINTNISLIEGDATEQGRSGDGETLVITYHNPLTELYSLGASSYLSDQGWDELEDFLISKNAEESTLILDDDLNQLSIKWHLQIGDGIREFYLGDAYQEKYDNIKLSEWDPEKTGEFILITKQQYSYSFENMQEIYDRHDHTEFYVYY